MVDWNIINKKIFYMVLIIFLISILFDFGITYYNYKVNTDFFFSHEMNKKLLDDLNNNIPFLFSSFIITQLVLLIVYIFTIKYYLSIQTDHQIKYFFIYLFFFFYYSLSILHFIGGVSWIFR